MSADGSERLPRRTGVRSSRAGVWEPHGTWPWRCELRWLSHRLSATWAQVKDRKGCPRSDIGTPGSGAASPRGQLGDRWRGGTRRLENRVGPALGTGEAASAVAGGLGEPAYGP